jgi:hypothetical protein
MKTAALKDKRSLFITEFVKSYLWEKKTKKENEIDWSTETYSEQSWSTLCCYSEDHLIPYLGSQMKWIVSKVDWPY